MIDITPIIPVIAVWVGSGVWQLAQPRYGHGELPDLFSGGD